MKTEEEIGRRTQILKGEIGGSLSSQEKEALEATSILSLQFSQLPNLSEEEHE